MPGLLPLETELQRRAGRDDDADDFWKRYQAVRSYLSSDYYPWIQANVPYFTDHGEKHVKSVLQATGSLLQTRLRASPAKSILSSLDIFLILSGVIWHDVGLVYGRSNHQNVSKITEKVKLIAFGNPDIHRFVDEISLAHSGTDGLSVPQKREQFSTANATYTVFPKALAAIVRFADEISENRSRVSQSLLQGGIPAKNEIYWEYADSISGSVAEPEKERVRLNVSVRSDKAKKEFECNDFPNRCNNRKITIIKYLVCRLEKMNNERAYCGLEFERFVRIKQIVAYFKLLQGTKRLEEYDTRIVMGDSGLRGTEYPDIKIFDDFFNRHREWNPTGTGSI